MDAQNTRVFVKICIGMIRLTNGSKLNQEAIYGEPEHAHILLWMVLILFSLVCPFTR